MYAYFYNVYTSLIVLLPEYFLHEMTRQPDNVGIFSYVTVKCILSSYIKCNVRDTCHADMVMQTWY